MTTTARRKTLLPLAIYVRLSRKPRDGKVRGSNAPSIDRQINHGIKKAQELGRPYVIYNEGVTSAFKGKRKEYARLIEDLRAGLLYGVTAWHEDRLCRNNQETLDWIDLTKELDFPTHTTTTGLLDLSSANGRAAAITIGAWNRAKSEHISEQVRDEMKEKALRGEFLGGKRPFGYEKDGITVRVAEAEELAKATARIVAGDSEASIMKDWAARGIKTTNGNDFTYSSFRELLLRVRNVGWVQYQKKTLDGVKAIWPAIVPLDDFLSCDRILRDPKRTTTTGNATKHLLGGVMNCPKCTKKMKSGWSSDRTKKRYRLYKCHVYRSMDMMDNFVTLAVLILLSRKEARQLLSVQKGDARTLEQEQDRIEREMEEAARSNAAKRITLNQLEIITGALQSELEEVRSRLADSSRTKVFGDLISSKDVSKAWEALPLSRKRAVINALFDITVLPVGRGFKGKPSEGFEIRLKNEVREVFRIGDLFTPQGLEWEDGPDEDQYREIVRAFS